MIKRVVGIYFSPAGGAEIMTKQLAAFVASGLRDCVTEEISIESFDLRDGAAPEPVLDEETIAVVGMPVNVGKIPLPGASALRKLDGSGALTLTCVSYGGNSYGNALYELRHITEELGFKVVGAGAFLVSYAAKRGSSRSSAPAVDMKTLAEFSKAASAKLARLSGCEIEGLRVKPAPLEVSGRMPVHKISRISPKAAAAAQNLLEKLSRRRRRSEWFL